MITRAIFKKQVLILSCISLFSYATFISPLHANPQNGVVVAGQAAISQSPGYTQINQSSDKAIINWQGFSINANEQTHFQQPSSSSITLNRVTGNQASQIMGKLSANGQIMLLNPAGIIFGPNSKVDVAGLIATTANISDNDFLAGKLHFTQNPANNAGIVNEGTITVADRGLAALVAPAVQNNGKIVANLGKVTLASGTEFTVDLQGDETIQFATGSKVTQSAMTPDGQLMKDAVSNAGQIYASGGKVVLTAQAAEGIVDNAINMSGVIEAKTIGSNKGVIVLSGDSEGNTRVSGTLDVSGLNTGETGGNIQVTGKHVKVTSTARIKATGDAGGGSIAIGGNAHGAGPLQNADTTTVEADSVIDASATHTGNGGDVVVWSNDQTDYAGSIVAKGGALGGDGGFVEVSGKSLLGFTGSVDLSAANGQTGNLLLDPYDITIRNSGSTTGGFTNPYTSSTSSSFVTVTDLQNALANANVTIQTGAGGSQNGDITVADAVSWTSTHMLRLIASGGIAINAPITATHGELWLSSIGDATLNSSVSVNSFTTFQNGSERTILGPSSSINVQNLLFNNPIILEANSSIIGSNGGAMSFTKIDSAPNTNYSLTITTNGTLDLNGGAGWRQALGSLTILGNGSATTTNDIVTTNTTTINVPITLLYSSITLGGAGDKTFNNAVNLNGKNLILAGSGTTTFNDAINGSGYIIQSAGTSVIGHDNSATTWNTTLNGGTMEIAVAQGALSGGNLTFNGGTLEANVSTSLANSFAVSGTGSTISGSNAITFSGNGTFNSGSTLNIDTANTVTFNGTLDGGASTAGNLVSTASNLIFNAAIGNTHSLQSITADTTTVNGGNVITSGDQAYNGPVTIGPATYFTSTNGSLTFNGQITGAHNLDLDAPGITTLNGDINVRYVGIHNHAGAITRLGLSNISVTNNLDSNNPIELNHNVTINGGSSNLAFTYINSASAATPYSLTLTTDGITILNGGAGRNTQLYSLSVGSHTPGSGSATLSNNVNTTNGATFNVPVAFNSPSITFYGTGDNLFNGTLNLNTTNLVLLGTGTTTFKDVISGSGGIALSNGTAVFNDTNLVNNTNTYTGDTTLNSGTLEIDMSTGALGTGTLNLNGGTLLADTSTSLTNALSISGTPTISGSNAITFSGNGTFNSGATLNIDTANTVTFNGTLDGASAGAGNLVSTASNLIFNAAIGNTHSLQSIAADTTTVNGGNVITSGDQTYNGPVTIGPASYFTSTGGSLTFNDAITGTANDLTLRASSAVTLNGDIDVNALSLASSGTTANLGLSTITVKAGVLFGVPILLNHDVTINGGSSNLAFTYINSASAITPYALTLNTDGVAILNGGAGTSTPLKSLTINGNGSATLSNNVNTTNGATFNVPVAFNSPSITFYGTGDNLFNGTLNLNTTNLVLLGTGTTTFKDVISGSGGIALSNGTAVFNDTNPINNTNTYTGDTTLNGGTLEIDMSNGALGTGTLKLNGGTLLATTSASLANNITVGGDATLGGNNDLTLTGDVTFNTGSTLNVNTNTDFEGTLKGLGNLISSAPHLTLANVSDTDPLNSITTSSGTSTYFNNGTIKTINDQTYGGTIYLQSDSTLTSNDGNLSFRGTIDGAHNLVLNALNGYMAFNSNIGTNGNPLTTLTVNGVTHLNTSIIHTTSDQTFNGAMVLGANAELTSDNGAIWLKQIDDSILGAHSLNINSNATIYLNGDIGSVTPISTLTTTGATKLNGNVTVYNNIQLNNNVEIMPNQIQIQSIAGNIIFNKTLNGLSDLILTANNGDIDFNDAVGNVAPIDNLIINNARNVNGNRSMNVNNFTQYNGSGTTNLNNLLAINGDINITTQNILGSMTGQNIYLDGIHNITLNVTAKTLTLNGLNGGILTGTIDGYSGELAALLAHLDTSAAGNFFFNGCLLPGGCVAPVTNYFPQQDSNVVTATDNNDALICTLESSNNPSTSKRCASSIVIKNKENEKI